ncbi:MAG: chemotaxis protein CheA, partial [Bacteroidetes bacterium]|nr:chemotaxis protein CheA [Bacteroidota bacterium]
MLINTDSEPNEEDDQDTEFEKAEKSLENLCKLIGSFCPGEIPDLGAMLNTCNDIEDKTEFIDSELFHEAASGCRNYLETMTLENIENTKPVEEGIILLKALLTHLKKGVVFPFDASDVMELLNHELDNSTSVEKPDEVKAPDEKQKPEEKTENLSPPQKISDEDMEILVDFISEANENLDSIEISLLELEHDPTDNEIINN